MSSISLLGDFCLDSGKKIIFARDFHLFFDPVLEVLGGKRALKKKSVSKLVQIFGRNNLVDKDISRIRNPTLKQHKFRKTHFSGFSNRRLDYIFISNNIQEHF